MPFESGDTVIHPHHGAVQVLARTTRTVNGKKRRYRPLLTEDGLRVMLPAGSLEEHGVREVMPKKQMKDVLAIISSEPAKQTGSWSRRFKQARERMHSGDPMLIAQVVRDFGAKEAAKGLSFAERRLFRQAHRHLAGEFAAIFDSEEKAVAKIDAAIAVHAPADAAA